MAIIGLDHIQIAIPEDCEESARAFYPSRITSPKPAAGSNADR